MGADRLKWVLEKDRGGFNPAWVACYWGELEEAIMHEEGKCTLVRSQTVCVFTQTECE